MNAIGLCYRTESLSLSESLSDKSLACFLSFLAFFCFFLSLESLSVRFATWSESRVPIFFQVFFPDPKDLVGLSLGLPSFENLQHSLVSWVVNDPSTAFHHLQYLSDHPFLRVPPSEPLLRCFLGTRGSFALGAGGCSCLNLIGSGFVVVPFGDDFLESFKILEHRARQFWDWMVRQVVLVPPSNGELRQDDTCMSSLGERNIFALRRCDSQQAVFNRGEHPYVFI